MARDNTAPAALYEPLFGSPQQGTYVLRPVYRRVEPRCKTVRTTPAAPCMEPYGATRQGNYVHRKRSRRLA